jgi:hypothetical protein
VREVVRGTFAGTPGRLRLYGAVAIFACFLFGALALTAAVSLRDDITHARDGAAQLVRVQTIRTSLVKADASATNAFLVGGLEPAAARASYTDGITSAARTIARAASANPKDAAALEAVNRVLSNYTGLIESARANNRQGFPIGAAYLRQASDTIQRDALPTLAALVAVEQQRVQKSVDAADSPFVLLVVIFVLTLIALAGLQIWMYRKTHRVFNPSLLIATTIVLVFGVVALGFMVWSRDRLETARDGAYRKTVALTTARINGFDAKGAEALTLINRGSGQPFEERFKTVSKAATAAMDRDLPKAPTDGDEARTIAAFKTYLTAHAQVRSADDAGNWDQAVVLATGSGEANRDFAAFDTVSARALTSEANSLSNKLDDARAPLDALGVFLFLFGIAAAVATWRGVNQRLREYR